MNTMIAGTIHPLLQAMSTSTPRLYPGPTLLRPHTKAELDKAQPPTPYTLLRRKG